MQFRLAHTRRFQADRLAVHVLYENITISGKQQPPVVATNIYRFNGQGWQMIFHHASPATEIGKSDVADDSTVTGAVVH